MEYSTQFLATPTPVDLIEGKEGLLKVTTFTELLSFTLRALLTGYGCSDDMLNRLENDSSIFSLHIAPIDFFITYNPHCFAACATNTSHSLNLPGTPAFVEQHEIIELIESLPGSFKSPGTYQRITAINDKSNTLENRTFYYNPPIFDTALRYLTLSTHTHIIGKVVSVKYYMVLYIPLHIK